jgi:hypothetical protein
MFRFEITRQPSDAKQTLGEAVVLKDGKSVFSCKTLELPWLNNLSQKSCIPKGQYRVRKRRSPKYGDHFHIQDVLGREFILIHQGNYHTQILGCILVGQAHVDINGDGYRDVTNSVVTMKALNKLLPNTFDLLIK